MLLQDISTSITTLVNNVPKVNLHIKFVSFTMVTVVTSITVVTSAAKCTVDFLFSLVTYIIMVISATKVTFGFLFDMVTCCSPPPPPHKISLHSSSYYPIVNWWYQIYCSTGRILASCFMQNIRIKSNPAAACGSQNLLFEVRKTSAYK